MALPLALFLALALALALFLVVAVVVVVGRQALGGKEGVGAQRLLAGELREQVQHALDGLEARGRGQGRGVVAPGGGLSWLGRRRGVRLGRVQDPLGAAAACKL